MYCAQIIIFLFDKVWSLESLRQRTSKLSLHFARLLCRKEGYLNLCSQQIRVLIALCSYQRSIICLKAWQFGSWKITYCFVYFTMKVWMWDSSFKCKYQVIVASNLMGFLFLYIFICYLSNQLIPAEWNSAVTNVKSS